MLSPHLERFNKALASFQVKFPRESWSDEFKNNLINDFTFYSARVENDKIKYGDTIKFLNDELVKKQNLASLLDVENHRDVLASLLSHYENFSLTEETIKSIHKDLMSCESAWDVDFKNHLIGNFRNIPTIGLREPYYPNKDYAPHFNLWTIVPTYIDIFNNKFSDIDNSDSQTHLITKLCYFHNKFLNEIHPFADGNGRVCRILMGIIMMKNNCPPIFKQITSEKDQFEYVETIVKCEQAGSDEPLIRYLADGLSDYLEEKLRED